MEAISLLIITAVAVSVGFFSGRRWINQDLIEAEAKIIELEQSQII